MGLPLMIQAEDHQRIEHLKNILHLNKKIDVLRSALDLLEEATEREEKIQQGIRAAQIVAANGSSRIVNKEFQAYSRLKRIHDHS